MCWSDVGVTGSLSTLDALTLNALCTFRKLRTTVGCSICPPLLIGLYCGESHLVVDASMARVMVVIVNVMMIVIVVLL